MFGVGFVKENVWSRQARRNMNLNMKMSKNMNNDNTTDIDVDVDDYRYHSALGFKVQLRLVGFCGSLQMHEKEEEEKVVRVTVRWFKGVDVVLFDSFCGMLKRKLEGR